MDDSKKRASEYCRSRSIDADFDNLLGTGQEGYIWKTTPSDSAIKVYDKLGNFEREIECYRILDEHNVAVIEGFNVPQLLGNDESLRVIEMTIVSAPYILDFGKAYVHQRPDCYTPEQLAEADALSEELFEGNWTLVESAIHKLECIGIYYVDANPRNIDCTGHPKAI